MNTCKTCKHWIAPTNNDSSHAQYICYPIDPDTYQRMDRGFESRLCKAPSQTLFESPVQANSFALTDGSDYMVAFSTGQDFGCVLHEHVTSSAAV